MAVRCNGRGWLVLMCFGLPALLPAPPCLAQSEPATWFRFDLYAVNAAFALAEAKGVAGTAVGNCPFLGDGKAETGLNCAKKLGRDWEELGVDFVAGGDGAVTIQLQGIWYELKRPDDIRLVWVDNVRVDGASLTNGDFEEATATGLPAGWALPGGLPPDRYRRDGSLAVSGKACLAVFIGGVARQEIAVRQGGHYRIRVAARVFDPAAIPEPLYARSEFVAPLYSQEVAVTFASEAMAAKARVEVAPLHNNYEWCVSSRWDDNNPADIQMRDVLAKHGQFGTFYLNGLYADWSSATPTTVSSFGQDLLKTGNSIGAHSLTHPLLSYCSRNRIFEEVAGDRLVWEAATDRPVISYAFSYCNFTNAQEGGAVHADINRVLERAGIINIASEPTYEDIRTDLVLSPIMPADGADIDGYISTVMQDPTFRRQHPNLTHSMHAWYTTPEAWAKFEAQLDKYGHNPAWWYCNQNQYAAYRYQFQYARLVPLGVAGRTVRLRLERPCLLDLNDAVPLTLIVDGTPAAEVATVACATAECVLATRADGPALVQLHHDRDQALPERIGLVPPNTRNRAELEENDYDSDFPGLKALLHVHNDTLRLLLDNRSEQPLTGLRVTWRLPLAWNEGVVRQAVGDLAAGSQREESLTLTVRNADYKYRSGNSFCVAQVDFRWAGKPGRLHVACYAPNADDRSYPQGGFLRLGPVPADEANVPKLLDDLRAGRVTTQPWRLSDGSRLEWAIADHAFASPYLDVELILGCGNAFRPAGGLYLFQGILKSPRDQDVELYSQPGAFVKMVVNHKVVAESTRVTLRQGDNPLFLIASPGWCYTLRVLIPGTRERLTDVQFVPPPSAPAAGPEYVPTGADKARRRTLAGTWRASITQSLPPAADMQSALPDPGLTEAARAAVAVDTDDSTWQEVAVPGRWRDYTGSWPRIDGEAVFRRTVEVPANWAGKDLVLSLGPVDDFDDTFFNGVLVGRTDGTTPEFYAVPRVYTVPGRLVKPGRNRIAVRQFDRFSEAGFTGEAAELYLAPKE